MVGSHPVGGAAGELLGGRKKKYKWIQTLGSIFSKGSAAQMLLATAVGIVVGQLLRWGTNDDEWRETLVEWVAFPGTAFIRLMKCFDIPLLATNIAVGVQGIVKLENAGSTGFRTGILYIFTSIVASIEGAWGEGEGAVV